MKKRTFKTLEEMEEQPVSANGKNKGGRPKKTTTLYNRKVNLYLSDEEYAELDEFMTTGWGDDNRSSASRFLLLHTLRQWQKKGKQPVSLRGKF